MSIRNTRTWTRPVFFDNENVAQTVTRMLADIAQRGAPAIDQYSQQWDKFQPKLVLLKHFTDYDLPVELAQAIQLAASRIRRFAQWQMQSLQSGSFSDEYGEYGLRANPIERVAAYIPGGKFPLISTALMSLIPASVAGVEMRIAMSPSLDPALLAAASLAGATHFLRIGGAQAIAAAAYGYGAIPAMDMIVGPGNRYVAEAKAQLQTKVRIDTVAGPSEVCILAGGEPPLPWLLQDCLAQCEHGPDALSVFVAHEQSLLENFLKLIEADKDASERLANQQIQLLLADSVDDAIDFTNRLAPEHLQLCDTEIDATRLRHFGALFIGAGSPVALGDYLSGPNHTLPTNGGARRSAGLSVADFMRWQTVQTIGNAAPLMRAAAIIAKAEGLSYHAQSLLTRVES